MSSVRERAGPLRALPQTEMPAVSACSKHSRSGIPMQLQHTVRRSNAVRVAAREGGLTSASSTSTALARIHSCENFLNTSIDGTNMHIHYSK